MGSRISHVIHYYHTALSGHLLFPQAFLIIFLSPKTSVSLIMFPPENLQLISWPSTSGTSSGKHLHAYHLQSDHLLRSQPPSVCLHCLLVGWIVGCLVVWSVGIRRGLLLLRPLASFDLHIVMTGRISCLPICPRRTEARRAGHYSCKRNK